MRSISQVLLSLGAAALLAGAPLAAQPALTGPEILVDSPSKVLVGLYHPLSSAADANGRLMVAWVERLGEVAQIRGRAFDASGRPVRPPFTLATGVQSQPAPTLTAAAPDGFLFAWQATERLGNVEVRRLLGRRLSPSGLPRGDLIQIRSHVTVPLNFPVGSMRAASAPDGSFVVVWSETNALTRREDVFFRRFDAAGKPLAKAALLPREGGNEQRSAPSLVVLKNEIRIAWSSRSGDGAAESLRVRRFDRNGVPLAASVQLLPVSAGASGSSVTFGPDGGCLAVWALRNTDNFLHFRAFAPDGTPFPEHQALRSGSYQATAERGGTYLVSGAETNGSFYCDLAGLQLEAGGTPRGPVGCLAGGVVYDASVTGTDDGGFALFWSQEKRYGEEGEVPRLFGQRLAGAGRPGTLRIERARSAILESASAPLELFILRRDGNAGTVSVEYTLTGAVVDSGTVVFPDGDSTPRAVSIPVSDDAIPGNDRTVHVALSQPTGGAVLGLPRQAVAEIRDDDEPSPLLARAEPFVDVAQNGRDSDVYDPSLAVSSGGDFAVAWGYSDYIWYANPPHFLYAVQSQHFDAAGKPGMSYDSGHSSHTTGWVRVAMHPAGDFMVLWQESRAEWWALGEGDYGVLQRFDARGAEAGPEVYLMKFAPDGAAPLPEGRFVAVGRGRDSAGEGLFAHFLSTNGIDRRSPALVTRDVLQPGSASAVATDGIGRSVVVWSVASTGAGAAGLFARRFNALGAPLGPPFRVSQEEGHDLLPSVAMNVQGNFAVAWQRSGRVYARAFNAAGAPLSDEILVDSDTEWVQEAPSVAVTGDGRFAVLWRSPSGVGGQLFASTGKRLGSEAQLAAAPGVPTIVWSDQGYFMTAIYSGGSIAVRRLPLTP